VDSVPDPFKRPTRFDATILKCLQHHGWYPVRGAAIAEKEYMTLVGVKAALAYVVDFGGDSRAYLLQGTYYSEGRNTLEPHAVAIPTNATAREVLRLATAFVEQAEDVIAGTNAARLLMH
jgi:hypothetical protein